MEDTRWMKEALVEAKRGLDESEVPVGAVVVLDGKIIGRGHNRVESLKDATAHAEIIAITSAANTINNWRLDNAEIYVTLEPCPMCAGAILLSRIKRCVFGAMDTKMGSFGSVYLIKAQNLEIVSGVMEEESKRLLETFFGKIRKE
jgi:tRNA(adenine34) deaminase